MIIQATGLFDRDYAGLPESIKEQADKQLSLFLGSPHHPSLRVKKIKGYEKIGEGRVTKDYHFTFHMEGEIYILRRIGTQNNLKTP